MPAHITGQWVAQKEDTREFQFVYQVVQHTERQEGIFYKKKGRKHSPLLSRTNESQLEVKK